MDPYALISSLQESLAPADGFLKAISRYGFSYQQLLVAAIVFWSGFTRIGGRLALGALISTISFATCRHFYASPRPYWEYPNLFKGMAEQSYGMPSGHTQNAVVFWGVIGYCIKRPWFWLLVTLSVSTIGLSRLYLGVHSPQQILAGLLTGLAILSLVMALEDKVIAFLDQCTVWQKLSIVIVCSLMPLAVVVIYRDVLGAATPAPGHFPYAKFIQYNGLLTGCAIGLLFSKPVTPSFFLFLTRGVPGAISVIWVWHFMPALAKLKAMPALYYFCLFGEFILLALWATMIWPSLHSRLFSRPVGLYH